MPIPRYDARNFNGVTKAMRESYDRDGVLVLEDMISPDRCDALKAHVESLLTDLDFDSHRNCFSTADKVQARNSYFLESAYGTHFFFEEDALDTQGHLTTDPMHALNKIGHAMHDTDPVFDAFARQHCLRRLVEAIGPKKPLLLQSMYIFKQPRIGAEVVCHQDATFLWTEPQSVFGLWVAIEDATVENGCLYGIPGGHKVGGVRQRFRRTPCGTSTRLETLDDTPFDVSKAEPIEARKGTVLAFHGLFPHMSGANQSGVSRHAFTLHSIDAAAHYPADNWLQRPETLPLRGF